MKKITLLLLLLFGFVGMQAFAQPSTITITAPTDATSVRLTGPWWGWDPNAGPVATQNTDGTWLISFPSVGTVNMEYLLIVDGVQEVLWDNAANAECTTRIEAGNLNTDYYSYGNRVWKASDGVDYSETFEDCSQMVFPGTNPAPTVAAPSPPVRNAADVVSIYSDAYDAISPINYDEAWCGPSAVTETTADGDNVFAYNGNSCQGIGFAGDIQDVTGLTNMHVDLFIAEGTDLVGKVFNVKIVYSAGGETSFNIDINALSTAPIPGTWYSYDALVSITGSNIRQVGITSNLNNVVWYDNLYFWKEAVDPATDTTLSDLTLDGTTVTGFEADKLTYDIILSKGTTVVPTLVGTPTQLSPATAVTTAATELPGTSTVLVTAQDGTTTETYTVNFTVDTNTECTGQTADYAYTFETLSNGTDVKVTIELLNTVVGLVAQYFNDGSGNQNPTLVSGQKYEYTFTGLTDGAEMAFTAGFAWAAGGQLQVSRTYTVGEDCATASIDKNNLLETSLYPNPAKGTLNISAKNTIESATIYNVLGKKVKSFTVNANTSSLDVSGLSRGIYILKYTANNAVGSMKFVKE
ncbi:T9SS type A sorting domain-containing protein [Polaribacter sp.]|nr:T9SS type A sorting domain-containing protein [Polaribacter sp.]